MDLRNVDTLVVGSAHVDAFGERRGPCADKVIAVVVLAADDLEVTSRRGIGAAMAARAACTGGRRDLFGCPDGGVASLESRNAALQVTSTVGVRYSITLSLGIAGGQTSLKRAGPSEAILEIVTVVVGAANDIKPGARSKFGGEFGPCSFAVASKASVGRLSERKHGSVHERAGNQGGSSEDGYEKHICRGCRWTVVLPKKGRSSNESRKQGTVMQKREPLLRDE